MSYQFSWCLLGVCVSCMFSVMCCLDSCGSLGRGVIPEGIAKGKASSVGYMPKHVGTQREGGTQSQVQHNQARRDLKRLAKG